MSDVKDPKDPKAKSEGDWLSGLRALASALSSRARWTARGGITFDGKRRVWEALGYLEEILPEDYWARYLRNSVAGGVVDAYPKATWRGEGELIEDEDPGKETAFERAWIELNQRLALWPMFCRVDILAGIGRYGILVLGGPGEPDTPLERCAPDELVYVNAFSEKDAKIMSWETDKFNPRFGLPTFYQVNQTAGNQIQFAMRVHFSRVIHVADGLLDNHVYGKPRLERPWNLLDDLEKVTGGGAEAFWRRADGGMQFDLDPTLKLSAEAEEKLNDETTEFIDGLRRVVRTRGMKINRLGSDVANFNGPAQAIIDQISAGSGIPQRILMGSERGELASSQDETAWGERVSDRRFDFAEPIVARPVVQRLIDLGVLPEPVEFTVRWPKFKELNENQKADVATKWATMNATQVKSGGKPVTTSEEIRDRCLLLPALSPEQVAQLEKEQQAAQAAAQPPAPGGEPPVAGEPKPKVPAVPQEPKVPKEPKIASAFELAVAQGKVVLDTAALREAIVNKDRDTVRALLEQATLTVKTTLKADVKERMS